MTLSPSEWHRVRELLWLTSDLQMTQLMSLFETDDFKSRNDDFEIDYDREVGGIVYKLTQWFFGNDGKTQAHIEACFNRFNGHYARAMRVNVGPNKGVWACYVSRVKRGE